MQPNRLTIFASPLLIVAMLLLAACATSAPPPRPQPQTTATPPATATHTPTPPATPPARAQLPAPRPTATRETITLTLWENLPQNQSAQLAAEIEDFQAQAPHIQVTVRQYSGPDSFLAPLQAGQQPFDVVLAAPALLSSLHAAGQIAPLDRLFPAPFLDDFSAVTRSGATAAGQLWGLPHTAGFHLMLFYNKALVATPPATTDDLLTLNQSLSAAAGPPALGLNAFDPLWLTPWLAPNGGWLVDDNGAPTLNSPAMVAALQLHQRWLNSIAPAQTYQEMMAQFGAGKLALMINGDWAIEELSASHGVEWGVAPLPALGQGDAAAPAAPLVLAKYWAISQNAPPERALAAAALLQFISQPERQLAWSAKFGALPTRGAALNDPLITTDAIRRVSAAQLQAGKTVPLGIPPNQLLDAMRPPLSQLLAGSISPAEAAAQMQQNLAP